MNLVTILDYSGVAVFAATGALSASRKQMDIISFMFLAGVTGVGGGTFRDLVLDVPVFWIANHDYILVCAAVAVLVFFTAHRVESRYKLLLWLDAIGLAVTGSPVVAIIMGMLTATFGGILRDVLAGEQSVLLRPEVYVSAALIGAGVYTLGDLAGFAPLICQLGGFIAAFAVRGGAIRFGWHIPAYKSRPGRKPEDIP
jgi:uncharacterized membrane protein YeiH